MAKAFPTLSSSPTIPAGRGPRRRSRLEGRPDPFRVPPVAFDARRVALTALTMFVLSALLSLHFLPDRVSLRPGQTSDQDIRATRTVQYVDQEATDALRQEAADQVKPDL